METKRIEYALVSKEKEDRAETRKKKHKRLQDAKKKRKTLDLED